MTAATKRRLTLGGILLALGGLALILRGNGAGPEWLRLAGALMTGIGGIAVGIGWKGKSVPA